MTTQIAATADAPSAPEQPAPMTTSVSSQVLGQAFNPMRWRWNLLLGTLTWEKPRANHITRHMNLHVDPCSEAAVRQFAMRGSVVLWEELNITVIPAEAASQTILAGQYAWIPGNESYPASWADMALQRSCSPIAAGPRVPGGFVEPLTIPCVYDWGVQQQFKPLPMIGGPPKFAVRVGLTACMLPSGARVEVDPNAQCYHFYMQGIARIST
jgi:hypothetical protein